MRILQVTPGYSPSLGGVQRHVEALSTALAARGHQVSVLSLDGRTASGPPTGRPSGPVEVHRLPGRPVGPFLLARGVRRQIRALAAEHDVVHVHDAHSPLPLAVLRGRSGRPVVVTTHYHGGDRSGPARVAHDVYRPLLRVALRSASAVVGVSHAEAGLVVRDFPGWRGRIRVVPNGSRPLDVSTALPAHWREPLVVCVSRLEAYQRVDVLLRALRMVNGPWRCVVVGTGPQRAALDELVETLDLADRVHLAGALPESDLDALLLRARVAVQPSARESFGTAVLDAVAAGCRVVASDVPAHLEVAALAGGGVATWPLSSGPVTLAAAVVRALCDVAKPLAPTLPTWPGVARELEALYRDLTPAAARSRPDTVAPGTVAPGTVAPGTGQRRVPDPVPSARVPPARRGEAGRATTE